MKDNWFNQHYMYVLENHGFAFCDFEFVIS